MELSNLKSKYQLNDLDYNLDHCLTGYRNDYSTYREAIDYDAVHTEPNGSDAFIEFDESHSRFYDLVEIVNLQQMITGMFDFNLGVVAKLESQYLFIDVKFVSWMVFDYQEDLKIHDLVNLAYLCLKDDQFALDYLDSEQSAKLSEVVNLSDR